MLLNKFAQGGASWSGKPSARPARPPGSQEVKRSLEPKKTEEFWPVWEKKNITATPVFGEVVLGSISNHFNAIIFSRSKDHLLLTIWFNAGGFQPSNGVTLGIESHHGRHRWPSTGCTYQMPSEALGVDKGYSILVEDCIIVAYRCISYSTNLDTVPTWYDAFMSSLCHSLCTCLLIKTVLTTMSHFSPTLGDKHLQNLRD